MIKKLSRNILNNTTLAFAYILDTQCKGLGFLEEKSIYDSYLLKFQCYNQAKIHGVSLKPSLYNVLWLNYSTDHIK